MAVTVLLELQAKGEKAAEMKQVFKEILPDTRAYDGCLGVDVIENQDDAANVVLIERWETRAKYETYLAWRQESGFIDRLGGYIAAPPSIRYFDPVDA